MGTTPTSSQASIRVGYRGDGNGLTSVPSPLQRRLNPLVRTGLRRIGKAGIQAVKGSIGETFKRPTGESRHLPRMPSKCQTR